MTRALAVRGRAMRDSIEVIRLKPGQCMADGEEEREEQEQRRQWEKKQQDYEDGRDREPEDEWAPERGGS